MSVWTKPVLYMLLLDDACPGPDTGQPGWERNQQMAVNAEKIASSIGRCEREDRVIRQRTAAAWHDTRSDSDGDDGA